jgi:NADH dehydrogenase
MDQRRGVVAVAGATGFVGRSVVAELLSRGFTARALARDARKAARVLAGDDARLEIVEGDVLEDGVAAGLVRTREGRAVDACVNLIGIIREAPGGQTFQRMHVGATRTLVEACVGAGVARFVQMSALGVSEQGATRYQQTKAEAERIVRGAMRPDGTGMAWTIIRPSLIHGPDGEFMQMAASWARGRKLPLVAMPYFVRSAPGGGFESAVVSPVYVGDVARVFGDVLENEEAVGEVYNLAGPERVTYPELLAWVRDHVPNGKQGMRIVGIPGKFAAMKAKAAARIGLRDALPFDDGMALMAIEDSTAEMHKAEEQLGVRLVPFRETMAQYARSM